jgi:hypothetical protein
MTFVHVIAVYSTVRRNIFSYFTNTRCAANLWLNEIRSSATRSRRRVAVSLVSPEARVIHQGLSDLGEIDAAAASLRRIEQLVSSVVAVVTWRIMSQKFDPSLILYRLLAASPANEIKPDLDTRVHVYERSLT